MASASSDTTAQPVSSLRVASGLRLRGVNHVGNFDQAAGASIWAEMWRLWDWDGWVRPQLDDIAKVGNAVRFWGNTLVVADGSVSLSLYIARWRQVLEYAHLKGLSVYPCGGDLRHWGATSWDLATDIYAELAVLLSSQTNVIGVDVTNEASSALAAPPSANSYRQDESPIQLLETLGGILRSSGLAVTHSRSIRDVAGWTNEYVTDGLGDFLDFHVYYVPDASDSTAAQQQAWGKGKSLIVGEFGVDLSDSPEMRIAYYEAVLAMCSYDSSCIGAFAWSAWDLDAKGTSAWGLFDGTRTMRPDIGSVFLEFPIERS